MSEFQVASSGVSSVSPFQMSSFVGDSILSNGLPGMLPGLLPAMLPGYSGRTSLDLFGTRSKETEDLWKTSPVSTSESSLLNPSRTTSLRSLTSTNLFKPSSQDSLLGTTSNLPLVGSLLDIIDPNLTLTSIKDDSILTTQTRLSGVVDGTGSAVASLTYRFNNRAAVPVTVGANGSFDQAFDLTGLGDGHHTLTVTAKDAAGNTTTTRLDVLLLLSPKSPSLNASLVRDTAPNGTTNADRITSDATISGVVKPANYGVEIDLGLANSLLGTVTGLVSLLANNRITEFKAGIDGTPSTQFVDVLSQVNTDGRFTFSQAQLDAIYGAPLPDGAHTLHLQAKDSCGGTQSFELNFVLDRVVTPTPILDLDADSDSGLKGDRLTNQRVVTLVGQTEANTTVVLNETGTTTTTDAQGNFEFTAVPLTSGLNTFTVQATDVAGNVGNSTTAFYQFSPPTEVKLNNSLVAENSENGALVGRFRTVDADDGELHTYVLEDDAEGRFQIVGDELQVAKGSLLDFEQNQIHYVTVRSTDGEGLSVSQVLAIQVTNVNEVPTFATTPVTTAEDGSLYRYDIVATDPDAGDRLTIAAASLPKGLKLVDNGDGTASLYGTPTLGDYDVDLTVTDVGGLTAVQSFTLEAAITMVEARNFTVVRPVSLKIPQEPSILSFKISPTFDRGSRNTINDAVEVALVDAQGRSLVHTVSSGRDTFFNWTEGQDTATAAGVSYDAETGIVQLNLTGIPAETAAKLIFRLVNDDQDTTTQVRIEDLVIATAPESTVAPVQAGVFDPTSGTTNPRLDITRLEDVSASFKAKYYQTSFNDDSNLLYTDVAVRNIGTYSTSVPLIVAIKNISDPAIQVRNADGFTADGLPYYDFSHLVQGGKLDAGDRSGKQTLTFYNPNGTQFTYELVMLTQLNEIPTIKTEAVTEVIQGKVYRYDVDAVDRDGDTLTYRLAEAPAGMAIDAETGKITWDTTTVNNGSYVVSVEVSDGRGGVDQQTFNLSVTDTPANRPPRFTSIPIVDARVNTPYAYQAIATDVDEDTVSFTLLNGPEGMVIDADTGLIQWTPTGRQTGRHDVVVQAEDGNGGTVQQRFVILTQIERGNHAPFITSTAPLTAYSATRYIYDVQALDPDRDALTYSLVGSPEGVTIDANGKIRWNNPIPKDIPYKIGVQVSDGRGGIDTQYFDLVVLPALGEIRGSIFNDLNGDGQRNQSIGNPNSTATVTYLTNDRIRLTNSSTRLEVAGGLARNGLVPLDGYYTVTDLTFNTTPTWSVDPVLRFADQSVVVLSNGSQTGAFGAPTYVDGKIRNTSTPNGVSIQADTELIGSRVKTTFSFTAAPGQTLDGMDFVFYAENDIRGIFNVADYTGTIGGGDLNLFQYSNDRAFTVALSGQANTGATLDLFGAGIWRNWGSTIEAGQFETALSSDGSKFARTGDLGLALGFSLSGDSASLVINYDEQPLPPEPALENRVVYIDANQNGQRDADETFTTTDAQGNYSFINVAPGHYLVAQENQPGWIQTRPLSQAYEVILEDKQIVGGLDFANILEVGGRIQGTVFDDLNGNAFFDSNEQRFQGAVVYIDSNQNGRREVGEQFTTTDATGSYTFNNLRAGHYVVGLEPLQGRNQTTPQGTQHVAVVSGQTSTNIDFGTAKIISDNQAPRFLAGFNTYTVNADERLTYQPSVVDPENDPLIYDLLVKPEGMVVDPRTGTVIWRPSSEQIGNHTILLRVRDSAGGMDIHKFEVKVDSSDFAPTFVTPLPVQAASVDRPYRYRVEARDPEGDAVTYSLSTSSSATIDATTGMITWTPEAAGAYTFAVTATDAAGNSTVQSFSLEAAEAGLNESPTITSTPRERARLNSPYFYEIKASDPDGDVLSYELLTHPEGMTLEDGILNWVPQSNQFGSYDVVVRISDGQGGTDTQSFSIDVTHRTSNSSPVITSIPTFVTNIDRVYEYNLTGTDPDGDYLVWSLDNAPKGMVIDPNSGVLRWQPKASQVGEHEISVRLVDSQGSFVGQTFTLQVNGTNLGPEIYSNPITGAVQGEAYRYTVVASDPESDALTFTLGNRPNGMSIDESGTISWTPQANQLGAQKVEVRVTDAQGATTVQTFTIQVGDTSVNRSPKITSTPIFLTATGQPYTYDVDATDPDSRDTISYRLLNGPNGLEINSQTGLITWATPVAGEYEIVVGAEDSRGQGTAQVYTLTARDNQAPVLQPAANAAPLTVGAPYRYDVRATDADGDRLSYKLDAESLAKGIRIDALGRLQWTPMAEQVGAHNVRITITDALGAKVQQQLELTVLEDTAAPLVNVTASQTIVKPGASVTFRASATDNVGVASLQLLVNGETYALDTRGLATVIVKDGWSSLNVEAIAKDAVGNTGRAETLVRVNTPNNGAPLVSLDLSTIPDGIISSPTSIFGSVQDPDNDPLTYKLEVAPVEGGAFRTVFEGTGAVLNGTLGTFDPSLLLNDSYIVQLTASDGIYSTSVQDTLSVEGDLKLGNFRLSFTDLSIPVSGIPIMLTRTYDSMTADRSDDFGFGWRMEFRDTDLRTSLGRDRQFEEFGVRSQAFDERTRVYITLPGGKRESFTFKPEHVLYIEGQPLGFLSKHTYEPKFVAEKGSTSTLTVEQTYITKGSDNRFYGLNGSEYNPADAQSGFGGVYVLTTKEGIKYRVDAETGDLLTVTDTNGNTLTYTDAGVTSSTGKTVTFNRDAQGRIVSVQDPMGYLLQYKYDAKGDLVRVIDREGNSTNLEYNGDRPHYLDKIIDPLGREGVKTEYDENGRLKYMIDAQGQRVELGYDPANSQQTVYDQLGNPTTYVYDERGNILTEVDAEGKVTTRVYDENNNVLSETETITEDGETKNFTTTYTYDGNNNQLSRTNPLGQTDYYTYNSRGQLTSSTDAIGNTTTYAFDSRGNVLSKTDAAGYTISYTYDSFGNPLTINEGANDLTTYKYNDFGYRTQKIDALGHVTNYTYDRNGNQLSETWKLTTADGVRTLTTTKTYDANGKEKTVLDAEGGLTQYTYDANGNQTLMIDALGRRTEMRYNDKNQLTETILPDQTPDTLLDNPRIRYGYDAVGNKTSITDQEGRTTLYTYDPLNRPTGLILPDDTPDNPEDNQRITVGYNDMGWMTSLVKDGVITEFEYDAMGQMTLTRNYKEGQIYETRTRYDEAGRKIATTDSLSRTTTYRYDELDRLVETIYADNTSTKITYNTAGRVLSQTDQLNRTTWFEYDALDRLTAVVDARQNRTEYGYNEAGNLIYQEDANDRVTRFEYDGLGRRTAVIRPLEQRSETVYDSVGNVIETTDFNGETIRYDYDPTNRLTAKHFLDEEQSTFLTYTAAGQRDTVTDARGITDYDYDAQGRLIARTDPDGKAITYTYDPVTGKVATISSSAGTTTYGYNSLGQLETVASAEGQTSYTYDAMGNLETVVLPNGNYQVYQYDSLNRLESLQTKNGEGDVIASYSYTYDAMGNRTSVEELGGRTVEYIYDDLNRLTNETVTDAVNGNQATSYTYDNVGNRLTKTETVNGQTVETSYTYDNNDRLLTETTVGVTTTYIYDNNGNLIAKQSDGQNITYDWDQENRLTGATTTSTTGSQQVDYQYDVDGVRVTSVVDGVETQYLVDTNRSYAQVIEEYTSDEQVTAAYVYGQQLISQTRSGETSFYLHDGHSGVRQLSDAAGAVTDVYTYDAYGNIVRCSGETENSYLYRGEQFDSNLGMQYLRARYYDQNSGRFASADPFEGVITAPITRHRYIYGNANPITYADPSGKSSIAASISDIGTATTIFSILASINAGIAIGAGIAALRGRYRGPVNWVGSLEFRTLSASIALPNISGIVGEASVSTVEGNRLISGSYSLYGIGGGFSAGISYPITFNQTKANLVLNSPRILGAEPSVLGGLVLFGTSTAINLGDPVGDAGSLFAAGITMGQGIGYATGTSGLDPFTSFSLSGSVGFSILNPPSKVEPINPTPSS